MSADLSRHIGEIARRLLGPPNDKLSSCEQLRFGSNGSLAVEIDGADVGKWFDHELGKGGGVWELIDTKGGMVNSEAVGWLKREFGIDIGETFTARIIQCYDYDDERGLLLFQVVRLRDPKDFRQRRPIGGGNWDWHTKSVRKVVYRLPELLSTSIEQTVFIAEGEKDVDRLRGIGLAATCNPGGAAKRGTDGKSGKPKWRPEYNSFFSGRDVAVIADNDDAGRDHAIDVAANLTPVARCVCVLELPGLLEKGDVSDWLDAGGTRDELERLAAEAPVFQNNRSAPNGSYTPDYETGRSTSSQKPIVRIEGGRIAEIVDEAERFLVKYDHGVFQRGDFVVRWAMVPVLIADNQKTLGLRLIQVRTNHLVERLTHWTDFQKWNAKVKDYVSIDCPPKVAATYLDRVGCWRLPVLTGVTTSPTLRHDGSILDQPGYDAATGIVYTPCCAFPEIPQKPSRDDALRALVILKALISQFDFVDEASRSVALSGFLTSTIRRSLLTAPLHAFNAPVAGSGKSKLVNIASIIASGHEAPVITPGETKEESEKRLGSQLLAGDAVISFDNCDGPLGNALLCQVLTESIVKIRILGKSETPSVPNNATMFATGNNLVLIGDLTRRCIRATLDPQCERPELRTFDDNDLIATVFRDRAKLLTAALTILRAHHVAGRPVGGTPLGSFETWSGWPRAALVWLGEADPCETMERVREDDPRRKALANVLIQWSAVFGADELTTKEAVDRATDYLPPPQPSADFNKTPRREFMNPQLREALLEVAAERGLVDTRRLGYWLRSVKGRIINDMRIVQGFRKDSWKVERVKR